MSSKLHWLLQKNADGWYLFPSIYVFPSNSSFSVSFEVGVTFLRWTFSVDFVMYRNKESKSE